MKKIIMLVSLFVCLAIPVFGNVSTNCPDIITMEHKEAFEQHRMPIVEFEHNKHIEEYGYNCGVCHHDNDGIPLNDITCEDKIDNCIDCHSEPGGNIRSPIEYFSGAIHQNCMDCHKEDGGPVSCNECHVRSE